MHEKYGRPIPRSIYRLLKEGINGTPSSQAFRDEDYWQRRSNPKYIPGEKDNAGAVATDRVSATY